MIRSLPASLRCHLVPAALWLGMTVFATAASAQSSAVTAPTVITSVPYTISVSGKYVLGNDLILSSTSSPAITISVANVNLDLNGYFISGVGDTTSENTLISVGDVAGVTIKNGTLANDGAGIVFTGSTDPRDYDVEGVTFTHLYLYGVFFEDTAIASKVYGCKFSALGGTTANGASFVVAIFTDGGVRSEKNTIDTITAPGGGTSYGIVNHYEENNDFAIGNTIANCQYGVLYYTYLNNLTTNITTQAFYQGTAATGNTSDND